MKYVLNLTEMGILEEEINSWYNAFLNAEGMHRPREGGKPESAEGEAEWQKAINAGYDPNGNYFQMFNENNSPIEIPEFHKCGRKRHWWVTKMMPGDFMPMHVDPHTITQKNAQRFWIPLQDWEMGHIFKYKDTIITNYKKGDVYDYEDAQALHGAANIGLVPRIVLQITLYEDE